MWAGHVNGQYYDFYHDAEGRIAAAIESSPDQGGWNSSQLEFPSNAVAYGGTHGDINVGHTLASNEYCSGAGGKSALDQVIADQYRHLTQYNNPLITVEGGGYVLVNGTVWQELANGSPQVTAVWVTLPHWKEEYADVGTWRTALTSNGGCYLNTQFSENYFGVYTDQWSDWDAKSRDWLKGPVPCSLITCTLVGRFESGPSTLI
jgi:hypothetical protein